MWLLFALIAGTCLLYVAWRIPGSMPLTGLWVGAIQGLMYGHFTRASRWARLSGIQQMLVVVLGPLGTLVIWRAGAAAAVAFLTCLVVAACVRAVGFEARKETGP